MDSASLSNLCTRGELPESKLLLVHDVDSYETSLDLSISEENHELNLKTEPNIFAASPPDYESSVILPLISPNNESESVSLNSVAVAGKPAPPPPTTQQLAGPANAFSYFSPLNSVTALYPP